MIFSVCLVGCDSLIDNDSDDGLLNSKFYGKWQQPYRLSNGTSGRVLPPLYYATISQDAITLFNYNEEEKCYVSELFTVDSSTNSSLTSTNVKTGEQSTSIFRLNDYDLTIEKDGDDLAYSPTNNIADYSGCQSLYDITSIEIELEMSYLPPYITINRDAQIAGQRQYSYRIDFDINNNEIIDSSDLSIIAMHYKGLGLYGSNREISISDLGANIWSYSQEQYSDHYSSSTGGSYSTKARVSQTDNVLAFNFKITQNPLLAHINENTPISVTTSLYYPEPEAEIIDGWQDGPWNWSSEVHTDYLPEIGFLQPSSYLEMLIDDASTDLVEGESDWVDIKSVQFKFIQ